jgi:hypothetical protein
VSDPYADVVQYRAHTKKTDSAQDALIENDLVAVSRWLDQRLGWFFTRDASPVARVYEVPGASRPLDWAYRPLDWAESENPFRWGNWRRDLHVDPIATTTGLVVKVDTDGDGDFADEAAWASTDYELLPRNADKDPEPRPWTAIRVPPWSSQGGFAAGQRVQVTACFGWPAVPPAIVAATIELTAIWRLESPRATNQVSMSLDNAIQTSPQAQGLVKQLMAQYRRPATVL